MNSLQRIRASHARVGSHAAASPEAAPTRSKSGRDVVKRTFDVLVGTVLLAIAIPLMLVVAVAVGTNSRGPILFKQRRLGRDMQPFTVLKFRTMVADSSPELHQRYIAELMSAEQASVVPPTGNGNGNGDVKKLTADPRVTRVGRYLRRVSLDELPQLFNVVGGTMSLVGPRPALEYELQHYSPEHFERFSVRPGVTGLWQVSGRNSLGFREMLDLDAKYAQDATLMTDISILARTPVAAVRHAA
jgi:lipopolysaccharide/colanic/teichoic acid biosynthesis glycosyltransferase